MRVEVPPLRVWLANFAFQWVMLSQGSGLIIISLGCVNKNEYVLHKELLEWWWMPCCTEVLVNYKIWVAEYSNFCILLTTEQFKTYFKTFAHNLTYLTPQKLMVKRIVYWTLKSGYPPAETQIRTEVNRVCQWLKKLDTEIPIGEHGGHFDGPL